MIAFVLRSEETLSRGVSPKMTVNPAWREETLDELLLPVLVLVCLAHASTGSSAVVLIWFNWLKQRLRFLNHESTLLNLLPNCLRNLRGCCPKWFFGSHGRVLALVSQRLNCGVGPSPRLTCL